jgi:hypothetical protein
MRFRTAHLISAAALALSISSASVFAQDAAPLSEITLQGDALVISNLAYNAANSSLIVGSLAGGAVSSVSGDGTLTPLIEDEAITSTSGLFVDSAANRLYVINSSGGFPASFDPSQMQLPEGFDPSQLPALPEGFDPSQFTPGQLPEGLDPSQMQLPEGFDPTQMLAMFGALDRSVGLIVYDLGTGQQLLNVDLSDVAPEGGSLATGIAVDSAGNAYITDGVAGVIYRVDGAGSAAFLSDSHFASEGIGLTGIVYHPNGYLLISKADGSLFKIPLNDPTNVQTVTIDGAPTGITSLALLADGRLAALDAQTGSLNVLTSTDDWTTAAVSSMVTAPQGATALTTDGTTLYVLQGFGSGMMLMAGQAQNGETPTLPTPTITQIGV